MKQRALSFPNIPDYRASSYVVSPCNADAYQWLHAWPAWSETMGTLITGEAFSGKTHLCYTFLEKHPHARMFNGYVCTSYHPFDLNESLFIIDDADKASPEWLFHLYNHIKAKNGNLILTTTKPHHEWCDLADLTSRLSTLQTFTLNLPDDNMMSALLRKNLNDCGVVVNESVLAYLTQRIDRSYTSLNECVHLLERLSAEQKRNITVSFARSILLGVHDVS